MRAYTFLAGLFFLLWTGLVQAATLNFNGSAVSGCSQSGAQYTCASLSMAENDGVVIASGYGVTVNSDVTIAYNQGLSMSGTASLTANKNLDFSNTSTPNLRITGGSLTAKGGSFKVGGQSNNVIVADITAATVSLGGTAVKVTGNITATGNIDISASSVLNGVISGGSISANSNVAISGSVKASGSVSIGSNSTISGPVSGSVVSTSSSVSITGDVTATSSFSLGSGSTLKGNTRAPVVSIDAASSQVQGDITASSSLTVGSGSQVKGNLTSPTIDLKASGLLVTGDVKASSTLTIASGNGIKGNVEGGNVTLDSSSAYITGNALVDHITLGWQGRVQQTISCKAYTPSAPCSCVTNNSGWAENSENGPKCGNSTLPALHHFQIEHSGTALTCAPQTVTVTACADAACSTTYTSGANVTVSPGGTATQIGSSGVAIATVRQYTVGSAILSLTSVPSTTGALVCKRTSDGSSSCNMNFLATGLTLTPVNHVSATQKSFGISVVQASSDAQACVPLFKNASKDLTLACAYSNPAGGTMPVFVQGTGAFVPLAPNNASACSTAGATVNLAFNDKGIATAMMSYADVGMLNLKATYTGSANSGDAGLSMTGNANVTVVPAAFSVAAIASPQRAGAPVTISVRAVNDAGNLTPNFGNEKTAETALPSLGSLINPTTDQITAPDKPARPDVQGSLVFKNGIGTSSDLSWPEVGKITVAFTLANTQGYLGANAALLGLPKASGLSGNVLFIPHHFMTELIKKDDADWLGAASGLAQPCAAPLTCADDGAQGRYAYSGQAIGLRVTARAQGDTTTRNYDGRDTTAMAPVQLDGWDAAKGSVAFPPSVPAGSRLTDGSLAQNTLTGVASGQFTQGVARPMVAYRFPGNAGVPVKVAPTDVRLRATSTYAGGAVVSSVSSLIQNEARMTVLSGQWMVPNSYGSAVLPIRLAVQVQYWNGVKWTTNLLDSINTFSKADVVLANCKKTLDCGALAVADGTYTVVNGALPQNKRLIVLAPGAGKAGSVDVAVAKHVYLASTVGSIVFGVFRSGPVIYLREMY